MTIDEPSEVVLAPERRTIDVVPDDERHGSPFSQFTLWFGARELRPGAADGLHPVERHQPHRLLPDLERRWTSARIRTYATRPVSANDPGMGAIRHADAGYGHANDVARGVRVPMAEG
jgi:hypothetical protein